MGRLADAGELGPEILDVGPWWRDAPPVEIDAVALAGRQRTAVRAGEAKWSRRMDGARLRRGLEHKAEVLPRPAPDLRYAVCAREEVTNAEGVLAVTARDVFSPA